MTPFSNRKNYHTTEDAGEATTCHHQQRSVAFAVSRAELSARFVGDVHLLIHQPSGLHLLGNTEVSIAT